MRPSHPLRHGASTRRSSSKKQAFMSHNLRGGFGLFTRLAGAQRSLGHCTLPSVQKAVPVLREPAPRAGQGTPAHSSVQVGRRPPPGKPHWAARAPLPAVGSKLELEYSGCARVGRAEPQPQEIPPKPPSGRENPSMRGRRGSRAVHARVPVFLSSRCRRQ